MKVIVVGSVTTRDVKTTIVGSDNKKYHNVKHGSYERGFWAYSIGVSKKLCNPDVDKEPMSLTDDNYKLIPIKRDGNPVVDKKDNIMYYLADDMSDEHRDDYLVLWNIPNACYRDVKYEFTGNVNEIGKGYNGKIRDNTQYISPSPVLEVVGPAVLRWSGITLNGDTVKQKIVFDNSNWIIEPIETISATK